MIVTHSIPTIVAVIRSLYFRVPDVSGVRPPPRTSSPSTSDSSVEIISKSEFFSFANVDMPAEEVATEVPETSGTDQSNEEAYKGKKLKSDPKNK